MLLKEVYNEKFLNLLAKTTTAIDKKFDQKKFLKILEDNWSAKELKQRMRAITIVLDQSLSSKNYPQKIEILKRVASEIPKDKSSGLALIVFPDYVEVFGRDDFEISMQVLEFFTEFGSSEFAVRQFIKLDQKRALLFFTKWAKSKNHHIRRLASEGCRPRLPWGEALPDFKKNPAAILPILENLKYDESEYVKKSISNNLNDISKDNPQIILDLLTKWQKEKVSERLVTHALRTLLKKGDQTAMKLIGVSSNNLSKNFAIQTFALQKAVVNISGNLLFEFSLHNQVPNNKIRLEYAVYFLRQNGTHGKKNFQITTKSFAEGVFKFTKKHNLRDMTTRKHYAGRHFISLVVNGVEFQKLQFDLI